MVERSSLRRRSTSISRQRFRMQVMPQTALQSSRRATICNEATQLQTTVKPPLKYHEVPKTAILHCLHPFVFIWPALQKYTANSARLSNSFAGLCFRVFYLITGLAPSLSYLIPYTFDSYYFHIPRPSSQFRCQRSSQFSFRVI